MTLIVPRAEKTWNEYKKKVFRGKNIKFNILNKIPNAEENIQNGKSKNLGFIKNGKVNKTEIEIDNKLWAVIDPLLGRTTDEKIAEFFQIPTDYIEVRRRSLHILPYDYIEWEILDSLFKYGTNEQIDKLFDARSKISLGDIITRRKAITNEVDLNTKE